MAWTLLSLKKTGIKNVVVVINSGDQLTQDFLTSFKELKIKIAIQKEARGMGDAVLSAEPHLEDSFVVLFPYMVNADKLVAPLLEKASAGAVLLVDETQEPWKYGILTVEKNRATGIIEKPPRGKETSRIKASGVYLLNKEYIKILESTPEAEYNFEDALNRYMKKARVETVSAPEPVMSLKYPWDLFRIRDYLLEKLPEKRAKTAKIAKSATLKGKVIIEDGAQIFDYATVQGPVYIGRNAVVGAYSILRDHSDLEEKAEIQRYVDCARSIIGPDSQIHTGFVGDSILGTGIRVGAGLTVANRRVDRASVEVEVEGEMVDTGRSYMGVLMGDDVKVGVNATFMPGIAVGAGSMIGPESFVMKNVEAGTLFYTDYKKAATVKKIR